MKPILSPPFCFRLCLFILCLSFVKGELYGQTPVIENLRSEIQHGKDDTLKVRHLNDLSSEYVDLGLFEEATLFGQQALELSQKLKFPSGMFAAYINLGNIDSDNGRNEEALKHYGLALELSRSLKDRRSESVCTNNAGLVYYNTGRYEKANELFSSALQLRKAIGDEVGEIDLYNNLGNVATLRGEYAQAIANYYEALKLSEKFNRKEGVVNAYNNIGVVFLYQGKYKESLDYFLQSKAVARELINQKMYGNILNNIGDIYYELQEYDNALAHYHEALAIRHAINDYQGLAVSYNNIGVIYEKNGSSEEALKNYNESILLQKKLGDDAGVSASLINTAHIHIHNQEYPAARLLLRESLLLSQHLGLKDRIRDIYFDLSTLDSLEGNWQGALDNYKLYRTYKDSLLNETISQQIESLKIEYETEKKENENIRLQLVNEKQMHTNQLLTKRNQIARLQLLYETDQRLLVENLSRTQSDSISRLSEQTAAQEKLATRERELRATEKLLNNKKILAKNLMIFLLTGLALLAGVITYLINKSRKAKLEQNLRDVEEKALRAQLKPHFVFNALASIQKYVRDNPGIAENYLSKFSHFTQEVLVNSEKKKIPLADELNMLEKYIELHSLRLKKPILYTFDLDPRIDPEDTFVPPAIFQPLVENSINHNFASRDGQGSINVNCKKEGNMLLCSIEDYCEGVSRRVESQPFRDKNRKSFGLGIVRERLNLWGKGKSSKGFLELMPQNQGMRVILGIPL